MQNTLHHPSTDTTGREENLAETPDTLTTQAPRDTNAPLLSAAPCSAIDCSKTLKEKVWEGTFFENAPNECFTESGKLKVRFNQNSPTILHTSDGHLIQLSPDNINDLLPQVEAEFYQGKAVSPEIVRQIWDVAKMNRLPFCGTQNLQS